MYTNNLKSVNRTDFREFFSNDNQCYLLIIAIPDSAMFADPSQGLRCYILIIYLYIIY